MIELGYSTSILQSGRIALEIITQEYSKFSVEAKLVQSDQQHLVVDTGVELFYI